MADVVKVTPPALLAAASKAAMIAETIAAPHPGVVPQVSPGSPIDTAAATLATGMAAKSAKMTAEVAGKGPQVQAATQSGVAQTQAQDEQSAAQMRQLGQGLSPQDARPHNGIQPAGYGTALPLDPPPVDPFPGWTDEQLRQVAVEIANGHAGLHFPGVSEPDLARRIYNVLKDPRSIGASDDGSGLLALGKDGTVIFVKPGDPDFGTAFVPQPTPNTDWKTPEEYFDKNARPLVPLPPPTPGRLPPVAPGEMAPPIISAPPALPTIGQHPLPNPAPPTVLDHPPVNVPPPVAEHPPLPPWLQNPSPPGFQVTPSQPPPIFKWDQPDPLPPPPAPAPAPAPGPPLNIHPPPIPPQQAEQGGILASLGAFGAWVLSKIVYPGRS